MCWRNQFQSVNSLVSPRWSFNTCCYFVPSCHGKSVVELLPLLQSKEPREVKNLRRLLFFSSFLLTDCLSAFHNNPNHLESSLAAP